jgi:hypothetical protein
MQASSRAVKAFKDALDKEAFEDAFRRSATADRPILDSLKDAYAAGIKAADPEAQAEFKAAFSELVESAKKASRNTRSSPLGPPLGHFANLASSLWEFAYWWGGVAALNQKTATGEEE